MAQQHETHLLQENMMTELTEHEVELVSGSSLTAVWAQLTYVFKSPKYNTLTPTATIGIRG